MSESQEIAPSEVAARLQEDDDLYLLDVRREDDYEEWHIEESHNLPIYDQLLDGNTDAIERRIDEFPEDRDIVTVCVAGITSTLTAEVLREHGYDARAMSDGMRGWGTVYQAHDTPIDGVTQIVRPGTGCLSYLFTDGDKALVVDPGMHTEVYHSLIDDRGLRLVGVADTHAHADHISGGPDLAADFDVPYYLHETDAHKRETYTPIEDGDELTVGERTVEVLFTPGHTRGSICFMLDGALLSGDTLFVRSVGRPDLEGGADVAREGAKLLYDSLERLDDLPGNTLVLPGHFSTEEMRPVAASLDEVVANNDLVGVDYREAFVEMILADLPEMPANHDRIKAINTGKEEPDEAAATLELGPNNCASN